MPYRVKTAVFEGPLDLLLQLITKHQVDVADVSLSDLVAEYLAYLEELRQLDLEVTSEFLLIAATLVQLKTRRLLPDDADFDLDEELALMEERDRLLARLLACATFKDVAAVLAYRMRESGRYVSREVGLEITVTQRPPEVVLPVGASQLADLAARVMARRTAGPSLDHLDLDLPSVDRAIIDLRSRMAESVEAGFEDLVAHCSRKVDVVAYFLALLELARWGAVQLTQDTASDPIMVRHLSADVPEDLTSEWSHG